MITGHVADKTIFRFRFRTYNGELKSLKTFYCMGTIMFNLASKSREMNFKKGSERIEGHLNFGFHKQ